VPCQRLRARSCDLGSSGVDEKQEEREGGPFSLRAYSDGHTCFGLHRPLGPTARLGGPPSKRRCTRFAPLTRPFIVIVGRIDIRLRH
jgi:hypothetical protein